MHVFYLCFCHSLSQVISRAICAVRDSLSISLCCTLCWAHTFADDTLTLWLSFINVYDKLMVDCKKNMMCMCLFFLIFFCITGGYFIFLYGSSLIHISAGHSELFGFRLLNRKEVTYPWEPFQSYFTEPSGTTSAFTSRRGGECSYHITQDASCT